MLKEQSKKLKITAKKMNSFLSKKGKKIRNLRRERLLLAKKSINQKRFESKESRIELLSPITSSVGMIARVLSKTSPIDIFNNLIRASGLILTGIIINNLPKITEKFNEVLDNIIKTLSPLRDTFEALKTEINQKYPRDRFEKDKENFKNDIAKIKQQLKPLEDFGKVVQDYLGMFKNKMLVMFPELSDFVKNQIDNFMLNRAIESLKEKTGTELGTETYNEANKELSYEDFIIQDKINLNVLTGIEKPLYSPNKIGEIYKVPPIEIILKPRSFLERNIPFLFSPDMIKAAKSIKNILFGEEVKEIDYKSTDFYGKSILDNTQSFVPVNKDYQLALNRNKKKHVIMAYQEIQNNIIEYVPIESENNQISMSNSSKISGIWRT